MDLSKGLNRNSDPTRQPPGTYPFAKNMVAMEKMGSMINEPGLVAAIGAGVTGDVIGVIPTDSTPVLITLYLDKLKFYTYDDSTQACTLVLDTALLSGAPDFSADNYFKGRSERNYRGDLVIAITNKVSRMMYINITDTSVYTAFEQLYLIPIMDPPVVSASTRVGGTLTDGVYFPFVAYENQDGTRTHFIYGGVSTVVSQRENKSSIIWNLSGLDQDYDYIILGVLKRSNGVTTAHQLPLIPLNAGSVQVNYEGGEVVTTILPEELLVIPPDYRTVGAVGNIDGELWIGNLSEEEEIDYQPYALDVNIKWKSKQIDCTNPPDEHKFGIERSFHHQEVYAFYIRLWMEGRPTKWYIVPGVAPTGADSSLYKIADTIHSHSSATESGDMGVWINQDELYPDHASFTSAAGRVLRGTQVLHHRFPSINFMKNNIYSAVASYGMTTLNMFGIEVSNVTLPPELVGRVDYYEIGYALRNSANSTIGATTAALGSIRRVTSGGGFIANPNEHITNGGNWGINGELTGGSPLAVTAPDAMRCLGPDLLHFKPSIEAYGLCVQYKLSLVQEYMSNYGTSDLKEIVKWDTVNPGTTATFPATIDIHEALHSQYVNNNGRSDVYGTELVNNELAESIYFIKLITGLTITYGDYVALAASATPPATTELHICTILQDFDNVFESFMDQQVIPCGNLTAPGSTMTAYTGDCFVGLSTFHTQTAYINWVYGDPTYAEAASFVWRTPMVSALNMHLRYVTDDVQSGFYPKSSLTSGGFCYNHEFRPELDPNVFGYNQDFNSLFDVDSGTIYSPYRDQVHDYPYRVHRLGRMESGNSRKSWRNILPLDYYELPRHLGSVQNIDSDDDLLLHMANGLLITRDKAKLLNGPVSVTLGSGDLFEFAPREGLRAPHGYAGTEHDIACIRYPGGYVFPDYKSGEIFNYSGGKLQNIGEGLLTFFRDNIGESDANIFTTAGMTIGYDPKYKRLLFTLKRASDSFTVSYSILTGQWASFHGYIPNFYIQTRDRLLALSGNQVYRVNEGPRGDCITSVEPFIIDVAVPFGQRMSLNAVEWMSEAAGNLTLTHITAWNSNQCTGRISMIDRAGRTVGNHRQTKGAWSFNTLRDIAISDDFLESLFLDFAVKASSINTSLPWHQKALLEDNFVIVRFEFDNLSNVELRLHDVDVDITKATR